jgi:hypothetical protein
VRINKAGRLLGCALWLLGAGCTSLREVPRGDYAAQPERHNVRIQTRDGLVYEFDVARVEGDSLLGFRERNVEGQFPDMASHRVALEDIEKLSSRGVDWYRTGLVGGGVLVAVVVAGLNAASRNNGDESSSGGTKPPIP